MAEYRERTRRRPVEVDIDDNDPDVEVNVQTGEERISVGELRDILRNVDRIDIIRLLAIVLSRR